MYALLESLAATGFLERTDAGSYALTPQAHAYIEREPAYLSRGDAPSEIAAGVAGVAATIRR